MSPQPAYPAAQAPGPVDPGSATPLHALGCYVLIVYLFLAYSRLMEFVVTPLRLLAILFVFLSVIALVTGLPSRILSIPLARPLLGFSLWLVPATAFSVWRGGSVEFVKNTWLISLGIFLFTAHLIGTVRQVGQAIATIAAALGLLGFLAQLLGHTDATGRLTLLFGRFGNSNDLAQVLLIGLSLWWATASRRGASIFTRALAAVCSLVMLLVILKTGSRAGLAAILLVAVVLFLRASLTVKFKLVCAAALLAGVAVVAIPGSLKVRYATMFKDVEQTSGDYVIETALGSAESRKELLIKSLKLTLQNPVLGVGPGMFTVAENDLAREAGMRGAWRETHNAFTQISSEAGIPALLLYFAAIIGAWRRNSRLYRRFRGDAALSDAAHMATSLNVALFIYVVTSLFSSVAYSFLLPTLLGLTAALDGAARRPAETALPAAPVPAYRVNSR